MKLKNILNEGRPQFQDTPNEFAYLDFKKWAYKNRGKIKKQLKSALGSRGEDGTGMYIELSRIWRFDWATKHAEEWSYLHSTGTAKSKFGRALAVMMIQDDLILDKKAWKKDNMITHIKEAYQKDGHKYNTEKVGTYDLRGYATSTDNAFVGQDGILGINNVFISWKEIKRLQKKYGRYAL